VACLAVYFLFAVYPDFRRRGVALGLVRAGRDYFGRHGVRAVFASVQRSNVGSLAAFDGAGFVRVGFLGLFGVFGWRVFSFYRLIWFFLGEVVLMYCFV
jgi:RimJ/RimL family protein N-acetyltransferase